MPGTSRVANLSWRRPFNARSEKVNGYPARRNARRNCPDIAAPPRRPAARFKASNWSKTLTCLVMNDQIQIEKTIEDRSVRGEGGEMEDKSHSDPTKATFAFLY
jgi:hypothetical protein